MLDINSKSKLLNNANIDSNVINYLQNRLSNLDIKVLGNTRGNIFELMNKGVLEGWCWETTESAIVFLDDDDYIERGYLTFDNIHATYYHSWICFSYNAIEYVFDPCLKIITKKSYYTHLFKTQVLAKIKAHDVKKQLIYSISSYINKESKNKYLNKFYDTYMDEEQKREAIVPSPDDVNEPLYRNGCGYIMEHNNKKIKKLKVHYYYSC